MSEMVFNRAWAMPSLNTFQCPPIKEFVERYLRHSFVSVDPFARNFKGCTWRNDLNVDTEAQYHLDARKFLGLMKTMGNRPDLVVLDPPYSPRQISECYKQLGVPCTQEDTQNGRFYKEVKDLTMELTNPHGTVVSCGWNSSGMGKERGFYIVEILLVCHGAAHNDTICMAERMAPRRGE